MEKLDTEKDSGKFWKEIGKMMDRRKKGWVEIFKNEQGEKLKTEREVVESFGRRLTTTFQISEEENEDFCEETEREVEEWIRKNGEKIRRREKNEIEDTPEITADLIKDILASFKEKAPGPSGITRNLLLGARRNVLEALAGIFTACLATGCFPDARKRAKVLMIPKAGKNPARIENYRPISLL